MSVADGIPAFPTNTENVDKEGACYANAGMTLRDYFAAHAPVSLATALEASGFTSLAPLATSKRIEVMQMLAELRSMYADAMIAERAK